MITYAILDTTPSDNPKYSAYNPRTKWNVLNPRWFTIPFDEMDAIYINEYQVLATRVDSSIEEMYQRALRRINNYFKRIHETYNKPIGIGDLVCAAYEGVLLRPPGGPRSSYLNKPRDDDAQIKYLETWLRAFSSAVLSGIDWFDYITIGSFQMIPPNVFLGDAHEGSTAGGLKVPAINTKARAIDTIRVYLDKTHPIEN